MPGMHLRQPGFTYNVLGPFTKNNERIKKFKETGDSIYIFIKTNQIKLVFNMIWLMEIFDNICVADLADTQLISKFNKGFRFLLCVIDIYSKKEITITNAFQKVLDESNHKPNTIWQIRAVIFTVDQ